MLIALLPLNTHVNISANMSAKRQTHCAQKLVFPGGKRYSRNNPLSELARTLATSQTGTASSAPQAASAPPAHQSAVWYVTPWQGPHGLGHLVAKQCIHQVRKSKARMCRQVENIKVQRLAMLGFSLALVKGVVFSDCSLQRLAGRSAKLPGTFKPSQPSRHHAQPYFLHPYCE